MAVRMSISTGAHSTVDSGGYVEFFNEPLLRLLTAVLVGGAIGLDRAFRGRAAGFRTHILVCLASCVAMLLMDFEWLHEANLNTDVMRLDPARMAQGMMTGIGFLGAGVIMQDRLSVRGLTTAASIWITACIGIVIGTGYYELALTSALLAIITLSIFSKLIEMLPMRHYAQLVLRFRRGAHWSEEEVRAMLKQHHLVISSLAYKLNDKGETMTYQMTVRTTRTQSFRAVAEAMLALPAVEEFSLTPQGD